MIKDREYQNLGQAPVEELQITVTCLLTAKAAPCKERKSQKTMGGGDTSYFREWKCISVNKRDIQGILITRGSTRKFDADALTFPEAADSPNVFNLRLKKK